MARPPSFTIILVVFGLFLGIVVFPNMAPYDPLTTNLSTQLLPPSPDHPLGTDYLGRDVFSRFLVGGQRTLLMGVLGTLLAVVGGVGLGLVSLSDNRVLRFFGRKITDIALTFPNILTALIVITLLGRGFWILNLAVAISQIAPVAYVTRTNGEIIRQREFITASYALGATNWHILFANVFPNLLPIILAYASLIFSFVLLNCSALSFLGLGDDPSLPEWGVMLADGRSSFRYAPWIAIAPGVALVLVNLVASYLANRHSKW